MPVDDTGRAPLPDRAGARPEPSPDPDLLNRLSERAGRELDTADLPVAGGDTVQIVCVGEVEQWLQGCAIRLRNGEPL